MSDTREFPDCPTCGRMQFPPHLMPLIPGPKVCYCSFRNLTRAERQELDAKFWSNLEPLDIEPTP